MNRHGPEGKPRITLARDAMVWAEANLLQPDRAGAGRPWQFTREQMRFLAWFYAIDERGDWLYTYTVLRRMKGWGKDPVAAVIAAIEFVGPCRFGGWRKDGKPEVVPVNSSWVQIAATALPQTRNAMLLFPSLFSPACIAQHKIDLGKEIIYAHSGRCQIQAVTNSARVIEGARSTLCVADETQHWLESNEGHVMAQAIRRNLAKTGGRALALTNAHRIGEESVAEQDWKAYEAGAPHLLYDSVEASDPPELRDVPLEQWPDDALRTALMEARGDSSWVPIDRMMLDCRDVRDSESYRRRFYLNQLKQEVSTWITAAEWQASEREEDVPAETWITLGFDGSRFRDTTALVATVVSTGYQWVLGYWEPTPEIDEQAVTLAVTAAFEKYNVWCLFADPYWWEETIARWAGRWGDDRVVFFHTNSQVKRLTTALKAYEKGVRVQELGHEPSTAFAQHVANAVKYEVNLKDEDGERLYGIRKQTKDSPRKIDIAMAATLSWAARLDALADGIGQGSVYEEREMLVL